MPDEEPVLIHYSNGYRQFYYLALIFTGVVIISLIRYLFLHKPINELGFILLFSIITIFLSFLFSFQSISILKKSELILVTIKKPFRTSQKEYEIGSLEKIKKYGEYFNHSTSYSIITKQGDQIPLLNAGRSASEGRANIEKLSEILRLKIESPLLFSDRS